MTVLIGSTAIMRFHGLLLCHIGQETVGPGDIDRVAIPALQEIIHKVPN